MDLHREEDIILGKEGMVRQDNWHILLKYIKLEHINMSIILVVLMFLFYLSIKFILYESH